MRGIKFWLISFLISASALGVEFFNLPTQAQQVCGTISSCPNASVPLSGNELTYVVQGGVSKKVTVGNLPANVNTSTLDATFCNTVGYLIARFTGVWACSKGIPVNITWLGAVGDGNISHASVNATALTNALATGNCALIPYTASGYNFGTNEIVIPNGGCITSDEQVELESSVSSGPFLYDEAAGQMTYTWNLHIDMTGAGSGTTALRFATSIENVDKINLGNLWFTNCVEAIGDDHSANQVFDLYASNILMQKTRGRQLYLSRTGGYIFFYQTTVDFSQDAQLVNWTGAEFDNVGGLDLIKFDVTGWGSGTRAYNSGVWGLDIETGTNVYFDRVLMDSTIGGGVKLNSVTRYTVVGSQTSLVAGNAWLLDNTSNGSWAADQCYGDVNGTGAAAGAVCFYVGGASSYNTFSSISSTYGTGDGLLFTDTATGNTVTSYAATNNEANAINFQSNSAGNIVDTGSISSNSTTVANTSSGVGNEVLNLNGYNPVGASVGTLPSSGSAYTAGLSPETDYLTGGTLSSVTIGGHAICSATPCTIALGPGESFTPTYSVTPTFIKSVH